MRIPVIHGIIARRILANYQVAADVLAQIVPPPFRPKLINGVGIAGICLIHLEQIKPQFIAGSFGISSENAAHRIAVQWDDNDRVREGVYIPRRDTSSRFNMLVGGRLFPGVYNHARFDVNEHNGAFQVAFESDDGQAHVLVAGRIASSLPTTSVFQSLEEASRFFEAGALGYSATRQAGVYDGLELRSLKWEVEPLAVERIQSSFFDNRSVFPEGSIKFDCALIMRDIPHEWRGRESLCCNEV